MNRCSTIGSPPGTSSTGTRDLLADDIFCLDDGPRVLDCIEFDDRLRYVDVLDDAAFLAMDVEHLGAAASARTFLDRYAEFSGDSAPAALRHHYLAYRAFVRAKVACLRHQQGEPSAAADVAHYADLTLQHLTTPGWSVSSSSAACPAPERPHSPAGSPTGSAPCCSAATASARNWPGSTPADPAAAEYRHGIYTAEWTERTYRELLHRARRLLERGETVVLDASWSREPLRRAAHLLATDTHVPLVGLRCTAAAATVAERLRRRAAAGTGRLGRRQRDRRRARCRRRFLARSAHGGDGRTPGARDAGRDRLHRPVRPSGGRNGGSLTVRLRRVRQCRAGRHLPGIRTAHCAV